MPISKTPWKTMSSLITMHSEAPVLEKSTMVAGIMTTSPLR